MFELKGKNISFKYKNNKWILKNLNISVKNDQIKGLIGDSGSGKSTLCKILSYYETKFEGEVKIEGLREDDKDPTIKNQSTAKPVQLIFQHPEKTMNPKWKMRDILNESWDVTDDLLEEFGIEESWLNRWPNELSGGELQRFSILRALNPATHFIIADEITTMLDSVTQGQIWHSLIKITKKRKIGTLLVSHDKNLIKEIADDVVHLNDINNI
jgi:peptide/nickel transport system ATP-binding protein